MLSLLLAFCAVQAGYHGFTAALPVALVRAGLPDPEIGLIVGIASIVQVPAAFFAGGLIDRFGGARVLLFGSLAYLAGAIVLALPLADAGAPGATAGFVLARVLQGIGGTTTTPAAFAVVPTLVNRSRVGVALAQAGAAQNVTMAVLPPISLFLLDVSGLHGVAAVVAGMVAVGTLLVIRFDRRYPVAAAADRRPRWLGFTWQRSWTLPLLIVTTMVVHWGVVVAYLAPLAEPAGVNVGLFFTADALAVFAFRVPVGWLVDRLPPRPFVLVGLATTLLSILLLLLPPSVPVFLVSGFFAGSGVLVIAPLLMVLSHRATDRDRGSAFAFFYVAMALGNAIGSVAGAPLVAIGGFPLAMVALGGTGLAVSAVLTFMDGGLGRQGGVAVRPALAAAADQRA